MFLARNLSFQPTTTEQITAIYTIYCIDKLLLLCIYCTVPYVYLYMKKLKIKLILSRLLRNS